MLQLETERLRHPRNGSEVTKPTPGYAQLCAERIMHKSARHVPDRAFDVHPDRRGRTPRENPPKSAIHLNSICRPESVLLKCRLLPYLSEPCQS